MPRIPYVLTATPVGRSLWQFGICGGVAITSIYLLPRDSLGNLGGIIAFLAMIVAAWFCGPTAATFGSVSLLFATRYRRYGASGLWSGYTAHDFTSVFVLTVVLVIVGWAGKLRRQAQVVVRHREEQLREQDRRKDQFLATLAHELRNPLAPIRTGLVLLRLTAESPPDRAMIAEVHSVMERQLEHMVRLIDDLLDVSRINTGKIELRREQLLLAEVIRDAVDSARPYISGAGHSLTIHQPAEEILVEADRARLLQIFTNLLNNAAKFTPAGGEIALVVTAFTERVTLRITDSGIGITPDVLPRIFDMFVQVDNILTRHHGGLGIGLSLSKYLVELHDGSIEAHSAGPGKGSQFTIGLPRIQSSPGTVPASGNQVAGMTEGKRVLIVDDNEDAARSLSLVLSKFGYETQVAIEAAAALALAASFQPQVFILDIGMPEVSGYDLARRLRSTAEFRHSMLVAVTGFGKVEDRLRSKEAGFNHHLVKPVSVAELRRVISSDPTE